MNSPMIDSHNKVTTLVRQVTPPNDVVIAYEQLTSSNNGFSALLETASISTKEHTRSVIALSAALQIRCSGERITISALNPNGRQCLSFISELFSQCQFQNDSLIVTVSHSALEQTVDEREKLHAPNVFDGLRVIAQALKTHTQDDQSTMMVGTFSFDCYGLFESLPNVQSPHEQDSDGQCDTDAFPDYDFYLIDRLLMIDHQTHVARLISKVFHGEQTETIYFDQQQQIMRDAETLAQNPVDSESIQLGTSVVDFDPINVSISDQDFAAMVEKAKENILAGDVFQLVLARDFKVQCDDALAAYRYLRASNPSPYMFYLKAHDYQLFGASPESAVKFEASSRRLSIYPIAGTRKRGKFPDGRIDHDKDARIEIELKNDEKEKAEHVMLVDLARNDIARVCQHDSRRIERLFEIDRYSHVMHLVSKVSGIVEDDLDALHAYQACMNMGTLSGAPKVRATQLIRQFEGKKRGVYGGAMGYVNAAGDMDTAIVIRSALVRNNMAQVTAGAGVVYDSQPELEVLETKNKAASVLSAIQQSSAHNTTHLKQTDQEGDKQHG